MKLRINKNHFFCLISIIYVLATLFVDIFRKLGSEYGLETIRNVIYIICFLFVIIHMLYKKKMSMDLVFFFCFFPIQSFLTMLITPQIKPVFSFFLLYYFSRDFVGYYLFSRLKNFKIFQDNIFLILIVAVGYSLMIIVQGFDNASYMASSYNLIIPTCILVMYGIKNFKMIYLIGGSVSFLTVFLYGARGALFCLGVGITLFLLWNLIKEKVSVFNVILIACISGMVILVLLNYNEILRELYRLTGSRTIRLIMSGNIVNGYGRREIYNAFIFEICKEPLKYRGILADRVLAAEMMKQPISRGTYAHNIIYEIVYEYGLILGTAILFFLFLIIGTCIYKVIKNKNYDLFILYISIFPAGFCSLFFSGSYLTTHYFWILMGLTYNILKGHFSHIEGKT